MPLHLREDPIMAQQPPATLWHANRLAVGNLMNHPPAGTFPSCVPIPFRWPTWQELGQRSPAFWARLVPHIEMKDGQVVRTAIGEKANSSPGTPEAERVWFPPWPHMGIALLAIRNLHPGEEIFWNYRLHPRTDLAARKTGAALQYPSWYTPVDDEALEAAVRAEVDNIE
ncbi:unnamed protein product [Polarella glacialis]|nr:unnamed protein product [Polarella glacialis]